jgi:hypothetical protein
VTSRQISRGRALAADLTLWRHLFPAIHPMLQQNQRRYHVKSGCILKRNCDIKSYNNMCRHYPCLAEIGRGGRTIDVRHLTKLSSADIMQRCDELMSSITGGIIPTLVQRTTRRQTYRSANLSAKNSTWPRLVLNMGRRDEKPAWPLVRLNTWHKAVPEFVHASGT